MMPCSTHKLPFTEQTTISEAATKHARKKGRSHSATRNRKISATDDQPEYINITTLDNSSSLGAKELVVQEERSETWKKRRAIGPDDRYNDNFEFDKYHSLSNDPSFNHQYGQLLDQRYQVPTLTEHRPKNDRTIMHDDINAALKTEPVKQRCREVDSQSNKPKPRRHLRDEGRSVTWHADKFKDFQIMGKQGKNVLVNIEKESRTNQVVKANKRRDDKVDWSPVKALQEIRREKEAPPKNMVHNRVKNFTTPTPECESEILPSKADHSSRKQRETDISKSDDLKDFIGLQKKRRDKFFESVFIDETSDSTQAKASKMLGEERKKSVRELLDDFEKKSQEIQDEGLATYAKELSGSRRRVCSDTETMNFESSSDDAVFEEDYFKKEKDSSAIKLDDPNDQDQLVEEDTLIEEDQKEEVHEVSDTKDSLNVPTIKEGQYLPMNPQGLKAFTAPITLEGQYLPMTPPKTKLQTDMESLQMSKESINSGASKSSMTPSEILIAHARTPSQSLVIEHLQKQFVNLETSEQTNPADISEERLPVLPMNYRGKEVSLLNPNSSRVKLPSESPRYCEIDDPKERSHYEYLYKARSATPLHYEAVYQEIPEDEKGQQYRFIPSTVRERLLPDIIGNAPAFQRHSSSDAEEDNVTNIASSKPLPPISDTFKPASFFLNSNQDVMHDRRGSQSSNLSQRELPQTPIEQRRRPTLDHSDGSIRGSISSIESNSRKKLWMQQKSMLQSNISPDKSKSDASEQEQVYPSVLDEEGEQLEHISLPSIPKRDRERPKSAITVPSVMNTKAKSPYYMSDITMDDSIIDSNTIERNRAIEQLQRNMEYLDAETNAHLNQTDLSFVSQQSLLSYPDQAANVLRSRSLEGLLGDSPGAARDSVQVQVVTSANPSPYPFAALPARGREPPPPPSEPNLGLYEDGDDDEIWRQSLRRASAKHRVQSTDNLKSPARTKPNKQHTDSHISGYVWDERTQRFYPISSPNSAANQKVLSPSFLDKGLPNINNNDSVTHSGQKLGRLQDSNNSTTNNRDPVKIKYNEKDLVAIPAPSTTSTSQSSVDLPAPPPQFTLPDQTEGEFCCK